MILFFVCICICADMDMTEWERCTFRGYILPPRMPESLCHPCITLMALVNLSCIILYSADLKPNIFSECFSSSSFFLPIFVPLVRIVRLKSFYEIPEMPHLQYRNAIMSRSVEEKEEVCQINIF